MVKHLPTKVHYGTSFIPMLSLVFIDLILTLGHMVYYFIDNINVVVNLNLSATHLVHFSLAITVQSLHIIFIFYILSYIVRIRIYKFPIYTNKI